jgi:hypothetical protein
MCETTSGAEERVGFFMKTIAPQILQKRWLHSHEEDTADKMVFRPEAFAFPRSRGRTGFDLRPDHSAVEINVAAGDGPQVREGKWQLNPDGTLAVWGASENKPRRIFQIISVDEDRLVVHK